MRGRHHPPSPDERAAAEDDYGLRGRLGRQANLPRNLALLCVDPSHQASVVQRGAATDLWDVFRGRRQIIYIYVICSGILSVLPHRGAVPEDVGATVAVAVVAENSWHVRVH